LRQDGTNDTPVTVPADDVDFADTWPQPLKQARRDTRPDSGPPLRALTQTHEQEEQRSSRASGPETLGIEEMMKRLLRVDVPAVTLKGNDTERVNR
jgi:hypothetical protein